jgi:hypothetical protein
MGLPDGVCTWPEIAAPLSSLISMKASVFSIRTSWDT